MKNLNATELQWVINLVIATGTSTGKTKHEIQEIVDKLASLREIK